KAMLVKERLKAGGRAVLNLDDVRVAQLLTPQAYGFSLQGDPRARVRGISFSSAREGIRLQAQVDDQVVEVHSPLVGGFNGENLLAALCTGVALGHPPLDVARWLGQVNT